MNTITIYDKNGEPRKGFESISIGVGSIRRYTLMKEDYILLKFTLEENIPLRIGDYVDLREYLGEEGMTPTDYDNPDFFTRWFVVDRDYYPSYDKNTGGWKYDLQINAFYYMWQNKIFVYEGRRTNPEAGVTLNDPIGRHAEMIAANLKSAEFSYLNEADEDYHCEFEDSLLNKGVKTVSYNAISILDAIKEIANVFECEWWVDYRAVHFGYRRYEGKGIIDIALNDDIESASTSKASGVYANRLYAFGGETNVPAHYRDALEFKVSKVNGNSVYDETKPVFSNLFRDDLLSNDAVTTKELYGSGPGGVFQSSKKSSDFYFRQHSMSYDETSYEAQQYKFTFKGFNPQVYISKIVTRGYTSYDFSLEFKWGVRLVKVDGDEVVDIINGHPTLTMKPQHLWWNTGSVTTLDTSSGYIGDYGTFRQGGGGGNNRTTTYGYMSGVLATKKVGGDTYQTLYWAGNDPILSKNDTHFDHSLSPLGWHTEGKVYTLFADDIPSGLYLGMTHANEDGATVVSNVTKSDAYKKLSPDATDFESTITVPKAGKYKLQFYVNLVSWSNLAEYDGNPCIAIGSKVDTFEFGIQKTAKAVTTKLERKVGEEWIEDEYKVIINPQFRDGKIEDGKTAEGSHEDSYEIRFDGENPLKEGDTFRLPDILRSRVPDAYFVQYSTGNLSVEVGDRNLMLPEGTEYVDAEGVTDDNAVEAIVVYDWIYPSTKLEVLEYKKGDKETPNLVRLNIPNFNKEMQVADKTLYMIPQEGFGAGYKFEIVPTDDKNDEGSWFIIKENNDYSVTIPNDYIYPKEGDDVILDGINVEFFDDGRAVEKAENALLKQAEKDIAELSKPNVVVDVTLRPQYSFEHGRFPLGQLVNIKGVLERDFDSRIIGFEEKLDYYYDHPKYFVGDTNYYSVLGNIDTKLTEIEKESAAMTGQYGKGGVKIITSTDDYIRPSEATVFSSARVENRFLHTDKDDEAEGTITFKKDIIVEGDTDINTLKVKGDEEVFGNSTIYGNSTIKGTQTNEQDVRAKKDVQVDGVVRVSKADDEDDDSIGMLVGNFFEQGDIVQGAKITKSGIASFAAIKTPSLQVYELVYNRKTAVQGEFIFSDGDTVEDVRYIGLDGVEHTPQEVDYEEYFPYRMKEDGSYDLDGDGRKVPNFKCIKLLLKTPYEGYMTSFQDNDILYSNINNIGASGDTATTGKCFMRVLSQEELNAIDVITQTDENAIYVTLYDDKDVPSRANMLPTAWMDITRHGNTVDPDRQDVFLISSEQGRLAQLVGVNSPVVSKDTSFGIVLGLLPEAIKDYIRNAGYGYINDKKPYLYAQGAVIQELILIDYKGKVIKTARFRGIWDKDVAESDDNKYRVTETTYDTVSYNGSLWQCNADETTEEPHAGSNAWILIVSKGEDGDMPTIYTIASSLTSIHQDANGRLNTNVLDIWVNAVGAPFNYEIKDQATLDAYNLSVWYNIDEEEDVRTRLTIGGADAIEIEEGGAIIVTEDDEGYNGSSITLESESIDISSVQSKINIYLVRGADEEGFGVDENRMYIPVLRDGNLPIILHSSPTVINIMRDAQEYSLLGSPNHTVYIGAKTSFAELDASTYRVEIHNGKGSNYRYSLGYDEDKKSHAVIAYFWGSMDDVPQNVFVEFFKKDTNESMGVLEIPVAMSERGLAGEQGASGAMIQPYGNWIEGTEYKLEKNAKGEVIGKPCVYHIEPNAEKGGYFVLEKDAAADIDIFNEEYWTPMTKIAYIYSDAIMANWAKFGSDKGAVFYDRYLFSQYGITKDGLFDHFSNHQGENGMWDENGDLSGEFTPSLFIDMYSGTTKADKFAETMQEYRYRDADGELLANEIRFYETYNVKYEPRVSWSGNTDTLSSSPRLLAMPLANNITDGNGVVLVEAQHDAELDGVKSTIIARANRGWSRKKEGTFKDITGVTPFSNIAELSSASLILCADPRLLNPYAWRQQGDSVFNPSLLVDDGWSVPQEIGRFVIDSKLTDFILLEAGKQIRLRSCKSGDVLYWYVENSEDFKEVPYEVYYQTDTMYDMDNDSLVKGNFNHQIGYRNEGSTSEYYRRTFASTSIAKYYEENVGSDVALAIRINAESNAGDSDWHWEQDITNIKIQSE